MVTVFELVGVGLGMASVFGLIVGLFSVWNGRATRTLILREEASTQTLIREMGEKLVAILDRMDRRLEAIEQRR